MDFNLKQWRDHDESDNNNEQQKSAKIPRQHHLQLESPLQQQEQVVDALPLFVSSDSTSHLSSFSDHSNAPIPSRMGGRYWFSMAQWQELELQALIYRHMVAGASVPSELLQLIKKSLLTSSTSPFYLHHYSSYFQPPVAAALLQSGYWGKGAMDPEPGRCRRTDGKKWRCSRDVVAGHKYCERHMHRGRNRSRKPVEIPAASTSAADVLVGSLHKPSTTNFASRTISAETQFSLSSSGVSSPLEAFQLNSGPSNKKTIFGPQLESSSASRDGEKSNRVLMHFLDDYPRSNDGDGNSTTLSMSTPRNSSSDFLRLSTGNGDEVGPRGGNGNENEESERGQQLSWGGAGGWGENPVSSMGGPLAEALRSSSNSSPTSVLHQLPRSAADTSIVGA